jgi:hypothetical protein
MIVGRSAIRVFEESESELSDYMNLFDFEKRLVYDTFILISGRGMEQAPLCAINIPRQL